MRRRVTVSLVGALVLLIVGSVGGSFTVSAGESGSLDSYLTSIGIDPDEAYFQEGLLNYAGPLCPGEGWNCTTDTSRPIVQTALAGGINLFECDPGINECTVVQREKGPDSVAAAGLFGGVAAAAPGQGPNNIAHCIRNDGPDPAAVQECEIIQTTPSGGKNSAVVTMIVNQNSHSATSTQTATQTATIQQTNSEGANIASLTQKVKQLASTEVSGAVSQSQEATQTAVVDQTSTSGENSFKGIQSQVQQVEATSGAGITQAQNKAVNGFNAAADVEQNSGSGPQSIVLNQSTDQTGNASSPGPVTQTQGAATGGNIEGKIHQKSSGVSTFDVDEDEFQTLNATTGATQVQLGPIKCCLILSQLGNAANTLTLDQNSILTANAGGMLNPDAQQTTTAITGFNTSGNGTANIHLQTNDEEFTDTCTGQTCFQVSRCEDGTCTSTDAEVDAGGAVAAGTGLRNRDTGEITITEIPEEATITKAVLLWGLLFNQADGTPPPTITFEGVPQVADTSQMSGELCWGDTDTIAFHKDVTALVTGKGNGTYTVSDPPVPTREPDNDPEGTLPYADGASLIVFFTGGGANNTVFSDFSYDTNTDQDGTIHREFLVDSVGGNADLILAGPDGQNNFSETFQFTGDGSFTLSDTWDGSDPQIEPPFPIGNLWDTDSYDVSSVLPEGQNTFKFDHIGGSDCIGVGAAVLVVSQTEPPPPS